MKVKEFLKRIKAMEGPVGECEIIVGNPFDCQITGVEDEGHQVVILIESDVATSGRRGGLKGGPARAAKMTPEQRSEAARKAANARWKRS